MKQITTVIALAIIALGSVIALSILGSKPESKPELDSFALCLAEKEFTMYGAEWCPHCKREKALFGSAWKYVPYVECPENVALCLSKDIKGYPTWIAKDGSRYEGEQGLQKISEASGCPLPEAL